MQRVISWKSLTKKFTQSRTYHRTKYINTQTKFASKFSENPTACEEITTEEDNTHYRNKRKIESLYIDIR